ncbi:mRNA-decapping enzyme-like protein [Dichanthelium oligosanthes]|uniref:mRNA-decapping enzyme-like protein n=1 Tax=Dichanthelium oligosanthes TaxID=888268 RepID=A0A1E5W863_9POAL|nr:mRNA-decapping enzyme-like protein [Dichanthelium oligosanthes]
MPPPPAPQPNGGKVTPNLAMDADATRLLNLTVLQRLDPAVEDILITAAHVTLYDFNIDLNQWSRKDVEGSLFVVKRNSQPRFQFIVMNRRNTDNSYGKAFMSSPMLFFSTDNLVEDLLSDFEYELQPPYLLYRNASQEVNGIWFYNQQDCEAVASLFGSEFEELEAVPTSAAIDGPLEPPPASTAVVLDTPEESLINYFSGAASIGSVSNTPLAGRVHPSTESVASSHVPLIIPSVAPTHQPPPSVPSSAPPLPIHDANARSTNLVTPAFFAPPPSSSTPLAPPGPSMMPTAPPLHPTSASAQRAYGTPLLQPFPPPTPPPSLAPAHNDRPVVTRDRVKDALQRLVQSDEFIDLVYQELQKSLV